MAGLQVFTNTRPQTFESLKTELRLSGVAARKFNALNSHIVNTVVMLGELVIIGDSTTQSSTSQEAYMMAKANEVHIALLSSGVGMDDFLLDNFDLLQSVLANGSLGAGIVGDLWNNQLDAVRKTLIEIERLHSEYLRSGTNAARDKFFAERALLFSKLGMQLDHVAAYGSGLQQQGSIKRMLGISTKSFMQKGEIDGYTQKIGAVAKAAKMVKNGTYIGTALDVASSALNIRKACSAGREDQCRKARYVEGGSLLGGLIGGAALGSITGGAATYGCVVVLGIASGGPGALVCGVVGGAVGGWAGGKIGGERGEQFGDYLYGNFAQ